MASAIDHMTVYRDEVSAQRDNLDMMLVTANQGVVDILDARVITQARLDDINVALASMGA